MIQQPAAAQGHLMNILDQFGRVRAAQLVDSRRYGR